MFLVRFDMRSRGDVPRTDLYRAAIEMSAFAEREGAIMAVVSEHHGSADGYLPSPIVLASAIAARTTTLPIQLAALIVPLHDPIRLAEDMAVLDVISGGRVSYIVAVGYVPEEFAMFDRDLKGRGKRMEESLHTLRSAWTGEPFEYEGRTVRVTPVPTTPGGPNLLMGGNSRAAIQRAARFGMSFIGQGRGDPDLEKLYREECERAGTLPGMCFIPPEGTVTTGFVSEDPDAAWAKLGPYMQHDAEAYAKWLESSDAITKSTALTPEALRAENGPYRVFTPDEAVAYIRGHGMLPLQPLCGGAPPELGWETLELLASKVLPVLREG